MHFFKTLLVAASGLALAAAQSSIQFTTTFMSINAGTPVQITWTGGSSGPVTLILRSGNPNNLDTVMTITTSAVGGSYSWTPPSDLPVRTDYALEIKQGTGDNYSNQFAILGGTGTALPGASSTAAASSTGLSTLFITTTTVTGSTTTASASATARNSTSSTSTTAKASTTSSSSTSGNTSVPNANSAAAGLASPLALVLSAVMAMIYLH